MLMPAEIEKITAGLPYIEDKTGCSDSRVLLYDDMVLKIEKQSSMTQKQSIMLEWIGNKLPVPEIFASTAEDGMSWLLMTRIKGRMSCDEEYMKKPEITVSAIAQGLKLMWKTDISDCPVVNTISDMLEDAGRHIEGIDKTAWHGAFPTPETQLEWLKKNKPDDDFVFSHGDFCMPNIMLEDGKISGFIDLAGSGAADRWYDIALCLQSLERNFSGFFGGRSYAGYKAEMLFDALGMKPDHEKIKFHLLLDELLSI